MLPQHPPGNEITRRPDNLPGGRQLGNGEGQLKRDSGRLNALKIGSDMAADAQSGLAMAARASNTEALGRARAQSVKNNDRSRMIGMIGGAASSSYIGSREEQWTSNLTDEVPFTQRKS